MGRVSFIIRKFSFHESEVCVCIVIACELLVLNGWHEAMRLGVNLKITVQTDIISLTYGVFLSPFSES